jgi:hypothetical protein
VDNVKQSPAGRLLVPPLEDPVVLEFPPLVPVEVPPLVLVPVPEVDVDGTMQVLSVPHTRPSQQFD